MKYVMFTKHLKGYPVDRIIEGVRRVGLDGVDLCVRDGYPVSPENCRSELPKVARQFAAEGLAIALVTTPTDLTDPSDQRAENVFAACAEAGVDAVKIGYWHWHSGVGYRSLLDDCRAKMAGFARLAEKYGVKACVHNHSGRTMTLSAIATLNIVRDFDPRHVGVFADVGHLSLVGEPLPMALELMWDYIHMFALKDLVWQKEVGSLEAPRRHKVVPFGHGLVEWASFVDVLRGRGYDGVLCLHSEYADYPPESLFDQAAIDRRFLERLFAQADAN